MCDLFLSKTVFSYVEFSSSMYSQHQRLILCLISAGKETAWTLAFFFSKKILFDVYIQPFFYDRPAINSLFPTFTTWIRLAP